MIEELVGDGEEIGIENSGYWMERGLRYRKERIIDGGVQGRRNSSEHRCRD